MKLCTYRKKTGEAIARAGLVIDGRVFDLAATIDDKRFRPASAPSADYMRTINVLADRKIFDAVRKLNDSIAEGADKAAEQLSAAPIVFDGTEIQLLAPLPRPNTLRDFLAFEQHLINATKTVARGRSRAAGFINQLVEKLRGRPLLLPPAAWYERPIYYKGSPDTVVGPGADIIWPKYTEKLDYELEFGIYLLGHSVDLSPDRAGEAIAGYTIFNDFSARDIQMREMGGRLGPAKGKDFDTGNVMGPYLVTPDEVGDPYKLKMSARVNGEFWSAGVSDGMNFSFEEMITYVSQNETLHPGDFFGSGTVGTGCGLELDRWIKPGDEVTLEVEKLGTLTNRIVRR